MKPSIPKGTRDFAPDQVRKRNYIFETLKEVFVKFGFQPIETPVMENLSTLTGKYGDEGDQLLFKVLNNGDFLSKVPEELLQNRDYKKMISSISKRGLRYDLTVPFARYVVMNQSSITFPFRRYQIQPVWRGDRPQKGRYQEFYQCDVDIVGSNSLINEVELLQILDEGLGKLKVNATIRLNNRKILAGMAEAAGISDQFMDMTVAIDKLDKIGIEGVKKEMVKREIPESAIEIIEQILRCTSLEQLQPFMTNSEIGQKGIEELETIFAYLQPYSFTNKLLFDISLARGLTYYTGAIVEVVSQDVKIGSIAAGGRYDDLTSLFGLPNLSGVGVSFGIDRIFDVMEELQLFPDTTTTGTQVILLSFDQESFQYSFKVLQQLRQAGIPAEIYPDQAKFKKQMKYANQRSIPYVIVTGSEEMQTGQLTFKNMTTGEQEKLTVDQIVGRFAP